MRQPTRARHGRGLHLGAGLRIWAPERVIIGENVYIGKDVHIETNCEIGSHCLIANRVAFVGRHDHEFDSPGVPVRFGRWVGSLPADDPRRLEAVIVEDDVWLGFGAILLSGVRVCRGAVVAAGSVVSKDVPSYAVVAGSPARVVGQRFAGAAEQRRHEEAIASGRFEFSERGPAHWIVEPGIAASTTPADRRPR